MKNLRTRTARMAWAAACLALLAGPARAEDIDIYSYVDANADLPNVLLVLDSSANWSASLPVPNCYYKEGGVLTSAGPSSAEQGKKVGIEKCALYNLIDSLPVKASGGPNNDALFNVGLMIFNESPAANSGGYPRRALAPLTTSSKIAFKQVIRNLDIQADKANNAAFAKTMHEAYLYFKGLDAYRGKAGTKWDPAAFTGNRYNSTAAGACGRNYLIFIANGGPGENTNGDARALLAAAGGDTAPLVYPSSVVTNSDQANWADEYARFMRGVDVSGREGMQGIVTHGVAVIGSSSDGNYPNFIRSMANYGGGQYFSASSADTLTLALQQVFDQIQAVDSVFASASLPVSVNARGTYLNQVYMGMFRPDAGGLPRWRGNLKQYQLGMDVLGNLSVVDANGASAISSSTGFIGPAAVSFWTAPSEFWMNQPMGTPASRSDSPDGEVVEKGGAAQRLRSTYAEASGTRQVLTCIGCTSGPVTPSAFADGNAAITQAALGVASAAARTNLIEWVRGNSNAGDEQGPTTPPATTTRPSVHGDVLHSRPAVVNYGSGTGVVVFYGANDGMLHAINGNQSGPGAGEELWSFVPEEMLGKLNRLRVDAPEVRVPSTPASSPATPRDYFVDGPISVYQKINASGGSDRVVIYVGMRRGGRQLYAFDVTTPSAPRFLWKKVGGSGDVTLLGQTWAEPKVARIKGHANPVLVVGGGYDAAAEDAASAGATTMGNVVYVLDAFSGAVLKTFTDLTGAGSIGRSIAADVSIADSDGDGKIDRAYAVDLGGQVYRIDFESSAGGFAVSDWSIRKFADLSGGTSTGRKFFFAPDIIVTRDFAALTFGSGDREKPLLTATQDHFFQLFDRETGKGLPAGFAPIVWDHLRRAGTESDVTGSGCYLPLDQGEKVVNASTSIAGYSFFGTNRPTALGSSQSCTVNLGTAKSYAMPLFCVASAGSVLTGGGLPPSPVAGLVTVSYTSAGGATLTRQVPFVIGAPNPSGSAIQATRPRPSVNAPRLRRYWYQEVRR